MNRVKSYSQIFLSLIRKESKLIFLKKIVINGFKSPSKSVQICFSEKQSSVIYGDNGCGKTTFLKILNAVFKQDDNVLLEEEVESIIIDYKTSTSTKFDRQEEQWIDKTVKISKIKENQEDLFREEHSEQDINLNRKGYLLKEAYFNKNVVNIFDWDSFSKSELAMSKSLSLGVDRGTQSSRLNLNTKILVNYLSRTHEFRSNFKNFNQVHDFADDLLMFLKKRNSSSIRGTNVIDYDENHVFLKEVNMDNIESTLLGRYRNARRSAARKIQSALFDTLASAITEQNEMGPKAPKLLPVNFNEIINRNKELLIEALDDKTENSFKDRIVKELRKINNEDDVNELRDNSLLSRLLLEMSEQLKDSEEELSAINTVIDRFDFFTGDDKKLIINNNAIKVKIGKNSHDINKLSSGERHILTLFTLLLDQGRHRNFIIIDEPEISLNATWQEALIPTLEELMPSCQIIAASHSPILAESIDNLAELEIIKDEEPLEIEETPKDKGSDEYDYV